MDFTDLAGLQWRASQINKTPQWLKDMKKGYSDSNHYEYLLYLAEKQHPFIMCEIGTHKGLGAMCLAKGYPYGMVYTVDINPASGEFVKDMWNVKRIIGDSVSVSDKVPNDIELLFIDGGHGWGNLTDDYNAYYPKVKKSGIICVDDMKYYQEVGHGWNHIRQEKLILDEIHNRWGFGVIIKQ